MLNVIDPPYALLSGLYFISTAFGKALDMNGAAPSEMPPPSYYLQWNNYVLLSIGGGAAGFIVLLIFLWRLETHVLDPETRVTAESTNSTEGQTEQETSVIESSDVDKEKDRVQLHAARWEGMGLVDGADGPEGDFILCCSLGKVKHNEVSLRYCFFCLCVTVEA